MTTAYTKQSILLPGGGDIDPICLPRGGALAQFFFPWGGDIAIFFPEMANSPGRGWALLELTDTLFHILLSCLQMCKSWQLCRTCCGILNDIFIDEII